MNAQAEEIWAILREITRKQDRFEDEVEASKRETDRILVELKLGQKELQESQKETDRILKALSAEIKEVSAEIKEVQKETAKEIKAVNTSIGRLGNRLGEFIEDALRPAAVRLFRERGIDVHEVCQNVTSERGDEAFEIDLLVINNNNVVAIECKSNLSHDDVNEHLARLQKIKRFMPRFETSNILGAVAGMVIPDNVAKYAIRQGLYVIGQSGEQLALRNDLEFTPKSW